MVQQRRWDKIDGQGEKFADYWKNKRYGYELLPQRLSEGKEGQGQVR